MSAGSMCLGVAALLIFGQICAEGQAGTENRTAGLASLEPASLFFYITSCVIADEFHWRVSSAERFLISPRSAVHADTFPTSSKPSPIPAERTDRARFDSSCARGVRFAL